MATAAANIPSLSVAILAITRHGAGLALEILKKLPGSVCYVPSRLGCPATENMVVFEKLEEAVRHAWSNHHALVCIMASGIVVRHLAPLVEHKALDPAVIVMDEQGQFVVSLLSGHLGGANALARRIARMTGGQAVITTASDVRGKPAIDLIARDANLAIENSAMVARLARAFLEEETIWIFDPYEHLKPHLQQEGNVLWTDDVLSDGRMPGPGEKGHSKEQLNVLRDGQSRVGIWVSEQLPPTDLCCLILRPRNLVVGLGCNRGTPTNEMLALIQRVFKDANLSLLSIRNLASIDLKADEQAILETGRRFDRPIAFYCKADLEQVSVPNPSNLVKVHVGVPSVCEATALLSAQQGKIIVPKKKSANVTVAVVRVS
ncbi:cobalt-precorrin 5A hydrolase [Desulfoferrobacter suflitae]|uniref:cobalt-precorrin 5A hydrolase n=1 Tax=Desulfoferrobacter suflitae TaxID=2865782 RepID=UPI002164EB11|nr:cobalamin biosynthesis protein [Desulfoferrobacter suflitae]MCK8603217.1 cobalamin biosynthesis protein [Desulfoferrobacter suflitae]